MNDRSANAVLRAAAHDPLRDGNVIDAGLRVILV